MTTTGLVALAVIAGAIAWPLITDNSASTESTDSTEVPSDEPTTPPSEDDSDEDTTSSAPPVSVGDVDSLSEILLTGDDLADGPGQTLEDNSVESSDDPDHPLLDYDYCESPDLTEVGAGANRVLKLDVLSISPNDIIASTVAVASSPEAAEAVIDDIIANASTCDSFDGGGLPVTITNATRTGDGAEIGLLISGLGVLDDTPLTVLLTTVDNLVLTLEIVSESPEQDRLWALLSERAVAYTSSAG